MNNTIAAPTQRELMQELRVTHLRCQIQAIEPIELPAQPGSALRGALYSALNRKFCGVAFDVASPEHRATCPVCRLLAAEDETASRGRNLPRPLTIEPPIAPDGDSLLVAPGEIFSFGISLIGWASSCFVYIVRALYDMGDAGIGRSRGRFRLLAIHEYDLGNERERLLVEERKVRHPTWPVTAEIIDARVAATLMTGQITLRFLSPLRLTAEGRLVKDAAPVSFVKRLIERCQALATTYSDSESPYPESIQARWREVHDLVSATAATLQVTSAELRWMEARSGSRRRGNATEIGGTLGNVTWQGNLTPLLPWLYWGQSLHVGKDAVKGDGWYRIEAPL